MSTENVKILLRRGFRDEITSATLETGEMGFTTDTNQLFVGIDDAIDEIQFDPFANAHAVIQSWLDSVDNPESGLVIDEDLVIRNVSDVEALLTAMNNTASFNVAEYGRPRQHVEVITENSFNQLFTDQHLSSLDLVTGLRPSLYRKTFTDTSGVFLKYHRDVCTSFFIDYSLKQYDDNATYVRVGQLKVINGYPMGITTTPAKLTDDNTEIWQDDSDGIAEVDEFSNIEFSASIVGDNLEIKFTQNANFTTEVSYTVKRWSM